VGQFRHVARSSGLAVCDTFGAMPGAPSA
jgi:hypothetical protein